jgi:hypothetical protein
MNMQKSELAKKAEDFERKLRPPKLRALARQLGVSTGSLRALGVGWSEVDSAWTFPEHDGLGNIVGILRRFADGRKKAVAGGRRGLYLPRGWQNGNGDIFVPVGASNVAAFLTLGLRAVGRPSRTGGTRYLHDLFSGTDHTVVIVGDNDRKTDDRWPGRDGARDVAATLRAERGNLVLWTLPPEGFKDIAEYLNRKAHSGTQECIG